MDSTKGDLIAEGKTKYIYTLKSSEHLVSIESKDDITAFNAKKKNVIPDKGVACNRLTTDVFAFLAKCGGFRQRMFVSRRLAHPNRHSKPSGAGAMRRKPRLRRPQTRNDPTGVHRPSRRYWLVS